MTSEIHLHSRSAESLSIAKKVVLLKSKKGVAVCIFMKCVTGECLCIEDGTGCCNRKGWRQMKGVTSSRILSWTHNYFKVKRSVLCSFYIFWGLFFFFFAFIDWTVKRSDRKWGREGQWRAAKGHRVESDPRPLQDTASVLRSPALPTEPPGRPSRFLYLIYLLITAWWLIVLWSKHARVINMHRCHSRQAGPSKQLLTRRK